MDSNEEAGAARNDRRDRRSGSAEDSGRRKGVVDIYLIVARSADGRDRTTSSRKADHETGVASMGRIGAFGERSILVTPGTGAKATRARRLVALLALSLAASAVAEAQQIALVFANSANQAERVCLGPGTYACENLASEAGSTNGLALGDVNGDHYTDAVLANINQRDRVCLGDGAGGFSCADVSLDAFDNRRVALGRINGDEHLDAVFANYSATQANQACFGDGTGQFTCSDVDAPAFRSHGVALGDVNGDSFTDAIFANVANLQSNRVCLGDGAGAFTCSDISAATQWSEGVALGDVDNDGDLDALFANEGGANTVCLGDGAGLFSCGNVSAESNSTSVALGDVNEDGNLDAVYSVGVAGAAANRLCLGSGTGSFTCSDVDTDLAPTQGVAAGRFDGDAHLDLVFANYQSEHRLCLGVGDGSFACADLSADLNDSFGVAGGFVSLRIFGADEGGAFEDGSVCGWDVAVGSGETCP